MSYYATDYDGNHQLILYTCSSSLYAKLNIQTLLTNLQTSLHKSVAIHHITMNKCILDGEFLDLHEYYQQNGAKQMTN